MKPEPLWRRALRRPLWQRQHDLQHGIHHVSDQDPFAAAHAARNRVINAIDKNTAKLQALIDRLDERQRQRAEAERKERERRRSSRR